LECDEEPKEERMPRIVREATVAWEGNVARGAGSISAASSGAFSGLPYSAASRIGSPEGKTSPEELLAAAHGGCFTMSLASELTKAGTPPTRLDVQCVVTMDEVEGKGHQIIHSAIEASGVVPDCDEAAFAQAAEAADAGCPFSTLIRAGATVSVAATLAP
jgi:osmotically inducible protein OsmC